MNAGDDDLRPWWIVFVITALVCFIAILTSCATSFSHERARQLGCLEACARFAGERGCVAATGWPLTEGECGCRMDDGSVHVTAERPRP